LEKLSTIFSKSGKKKVAYPDTNCRTFSIIISMVSRDIRESEIEQGAFWVSVAKDTVVATINANNPVKDIIYSKGVTRAQLEDIFTHIYNDRTYKTWGQLVGNESISNERIGFLGRYHFIKNVHEN
jgi:ABC-type phosphate transport system substrate-binding protein